MIWPFDHGGVLALYLATLALHAVFVSYVVAGTAYALIRRDAVATTVRDRLPFMLGCGITAGVAPLLFVQLLHQRRFYTANLLLGPRWLVVVPALIVGFYGLYLQKTSDRWRRAALVVALACFLFVAWSWSELHELMQADPEWRELYAAGHRFFTAATIAPRLAIIAGAMATSFALVAAWSADSAGRARLAPIAAGGRLVSIGGAIWLWHTGFAVAGPARAWFAILAVAAVIDLSAWAVMLQRPTDRVLAIATAAGTAVMLAAVIVREAPRIALIEAPVPLAAGAGGLVVFGIALIGGIAAITWILGVASGPRR